MKILPIEKVREADSYTIENEPIQSIDLMERAGTTCSEWIKKNINKTKKIKVFCGPGNNGGDGLVVARLLSDQNYSVDVCVIRFTEKASEDFTINYQRLEKYQNVKIINLYEKDKLPKISKDEIIVDAIFGSGLSKPIKGFIAKVIKHINSSEAIIISVDVPSGLFCDTSSINSGGAIIKADYTLTFQFPKFAFLFPENEQFVGNWKVLSIGLHKDYINSLDVKNYFVEKEYFKDYLIKRKKFSHKGNFGHALLIAGSYGKMGAAVLASEACLRSGAGLLTCHIPKKGYEIIQTSLPEAMVSIDKSDEFFTKSPDISFYNAIGIGPGLGNNELTQTALKLLIQNSNIPLLFDADAINIISENKTWLHFLPKGCIFTPHPKEFERLVGKSKNNFERNEMQREFSIKFNCYLVLKGAFTAITCPDGSCFFNSTGNPGMATGGSGDVLTGVILGLLAQNYHPKIASILGVYLHGLAGDYAAKKIGQESMIAGDIIKYLRKAFRMIKDE
ncbi:MAG: NAD(P)H-hydrate dehydratase [Bacteroidales bacterium]|nr:NAD(P)H-hydrate dehydratase [Bacteroidales bacterium]